MGAPAIAGVTLEFAPEAGSRKAKSGRRAGSRQRQADVEAALNAVKQAGITSYRLEVAPDGTISIVVGAVDSEAKP
jgi:hypothetical protein